MLNLSRVFTSLGLTKKMRAQLALTVVYLTIFPFISQGASQGDVIISEVAWMGSKIDGIDSKNWWRYEWLEIYNNSESLIRLDGWKIELYGTDLNWSLVLKGDLPANGYFLAVSSDKIFPFSQNYSDLKGRLANSGQKIVLKDNFDNIIDEVDCSKGWFAGNNSTKQTMERIDFLKTGNDSTNWITSINPNGTPGGKSSEKTGIEPKKTIEIKKTEIASASSAKITLGAEKALADAGSYPRQGPHLSIIFAAIFCSLVSGSAILFLKRNSEK